MPGGLSPTLIVKVPSGISTASGCSNNAAAIPLMEETTFALTVPKPPRHSIVTLAAAPACAPAVMVAVMVSLAPALIDTFNTRADKLTGANSAVI